jgi:lysophospholipase L1-like esterase
MPIADQRSYLADTVAILHKLWPDNRTVNIVFHGHSVPSGYFATPFVDTFCAYPHLLHVRLKRRFPYAVVNAIVTAIGGEGSGTGATRFVDEVLCHRPDVVAIDYGLNDRGMGLAAAETNWRCMIEAAISRKVKVLLLTPTADVTVGAGYAGEDAGLLAQHAEQIRRLAAEYDVGLVDSLALFLDYHRTGNLDDLLSWPNHPNAAGHALVADALMRWFPVA